MQLATITDKLSKAGCNSLPSSSHFKTRSGRSLGTWNHSIPDALGPPPKSALIRKVFSLQDIEKVGLGRVLIECPHFRGLELRHCILQAMS